MLTQSSNIWCFVSFLPSRRLSLFTSYQINPKTTKPDGGRSRDRRGIDGVARCFRARNLWTLMLRRTTTGQRCRVPNGDRGRTIAYRWDRDMPTRLQAFPSGLVFCFSNLLCARWQPWSLDELKLRSDPRDPESQLPLFKLSIEFIYEWLDSWYFGAWMTSSIYRCFVLFLLFPELRT